VDKISAVINHKMDTAVSPLVCADHCAHLLKYKFSEVATKGEKLAEVLAYGYELYKYDMLLLFSDPYIEAQALGCPISLDPYPSLLGPKSHDRFDRTQEIIKAAQILKTKVDVPVFVSIKGPFSLAAFLGGIEDFLKILLRNENEAFALLEEATQFQNRYLDRLLQVGLNIFIGDPLSSSSVISPAVFKKFALEPIKALVKKIKEQGFLAGIHICGNTKPIMKALDTSGADILSIEDIAVKTRTTRMGGVSTHTILHGDGRNVAAEVKEAYVNKPLIFSTSCDVPPQTNPENIKTMIRVAREFSEC
jgi:uroporphyrinogen decarboxylase